MQLQLWDIDQVGKHLKCSRTKTWGLRRLPDFPQAVWIQGRVRYRAEEIRAWHRRHPDTAAALKAGSK